jgi:thiol-disulfide isomerase/thioredoxin
MLTLPKMQKNTMGVCVVCVILLSMIVAYVVYVQFFENKKEKFEHGNSRKTMIFFRANWCGHCQRFKPVWDEFVNDVNASDTMNIDIQELDIDLPESKPFIEKHNVRGFPHLVLVDNESNNEKVFDKNRTKEDLIAFIKENL